MSILLVTSRVQHVIGVLSRVAGGRQFLFGLDQILSSASNALLSFGALAIASTTEFGRFALGLAVLGVGVGLVRSAILEWELVDGAAPSDPVSLLRRSIILAGLVSVPGMAVIALVGAAPLMVAGLFVLATLSSAACDTFRFVALGRNEPVEACILDASWLSAMVVSMGVAYVFGVLSLSMVLLVYSTSAVVGVLTSYSRMRRYRGRERNLAPRSPRSIMFGTDFALNVASGHAVTFLLPAMFGLSTLGSYRAALTVFQPFTTVAYSLRLWHLKHLDWRASPRRTWLLAVGGQAVLGIVCVGPVLLAYSVGLFGGVPSLEQVGITVLLLAAASETIRTASQVSFDLARVFGFLRTVVVNRLVQIVVLVGGSVVLTYYYGISGAMAARIGAYGLAMVGGLAGVRERYRRRGRVQVRPSGLDREEGPG